MLINTGGKMLIPFDGPLPVSSGKSPQLRFYVSNIVGVVKVSYATRSNLTDLKDTDYVITPGWNTVDIPEVQGKEFIAFGLDAEDGAVTLSYIEASVDRYLADMPTAEPGDDIEITIQDSEYSSHLLSALHMVYRDGYYL
jgi:hypothetical protein